MRRSRTARHPLLVVLSACLLAVLCCVLGAPDALAVQVRVRGASEIDLLASELEDAVKIRGEISDEMGASLGRVSVKIEAVDGAGKPARLEAPSNCNPSDAPGTVRSDRTAYVVTTDERGSFCVVAPGRFRGLTFRASFAGNKLFDGSDAAAAPVPESEQRAHLTIRFESPPTTLDLDKDAHTITVSMRIARTDASRLFLDSSKKQGLPLTLTDERGTVVARGTTGGDGRARFEVKSADLAAPGDGELRAEFAGDPQLMQAKTTLPITRTARAVIEAQGSVEGDPDTGLSFDVEVTSPHGAVDGGIIEALLGNDAVGTGKVEAGKAKITVTFPGGAAARVPITLRYVPSSPFWQAGDTAKVDVVIAGPSPIRQAVLALVGLALVAWIVAEWRRAPKSEKGESVLPPPPSGRPEILVLDRPSGLKGWRGVVTDAHDGHPIAGAELRIVVPSFDGRGELDRAVTDGEGTFSLDRADVPRDARLVVEGELHATYEQQLPAPSVLRVALVTRRRALLDRLVRWARLRGSPFDSSKEPTPGHVRRVAARTGSAKIESWASQVEQAAFGQRDVTRDVEIGVMGFEPRAHTAEGPPLTQNMPPDGSPDAPPRSGSARAGMKFQVPRCLPQQPSI